MSSDELTSDADLTKVCFAKQEGVSAPRRLRDPTPRPKRSKCAVHRPSPRKSRFSSKAAGFSTVMAVARRTIRVVQPPTAHDALTIVPLKLVQSPSRPGLIITCRYRRITSCTKEIAGCAVEGSIHPVALAEGGTAPPPLTPMSKPVNCRSAPP